MTGVGVAQATALGVEDGVKAGDEHVGRDVGKEHLVDSLEHLGWRGMALGCEAQHATGRGHNERCWHPLARCIPHHESEPTLREEVEVVEVPAYLPGWLVVGGDLPALQGGHLLGQRGLLNASGHPKILLYALALAHLSLEMRLGYLRRTAPLAPLFGDLAPHFAVHGHRRHLYLLVPWH